MSTSKAYHHGDLRAALVAQGMALLGEGDADADALSLRAMARRAGVSATAVYRHFPDKAALLSALAHEGLVQLATAQHAAFDAAGGGIDGFSATGAAYVRFALANPALFRLIFAAPPAADMMAADEEAMTFLQANAAALAPVETNASTFALQAWAIAHGLAMLMLDGQVAPDDATIDAVVDAHAMLGGSAMAPGKPRR